MAKKVLSIAADSALRISRQLILEQAGFEVASASGLEEALAVCEQSRFALFILGQTSSEDEQKKLAKLLRKKCPGVPFLELHSHGTAYLPKADYSLETMDGPEALVLTVQRIFEKAGQKAEEKSAEKVAPASEKSRQNAQRA